jgi:hypothetical protein
MDGGVRSPHVGGEADRSQRPLNSPNSFESETLLRSKPAFVFLRRGAGSLTLRPSTGYAEQKNFLFILCLHDTFQYRDLVTT